MEYSLYLCIQQNIKTMESKELTNQITNYLNTFSVDDRIKELNTAMSSEHPTLQQNFTRMCVGWLEHVSTPEYYTDGRNESTKDFGILFKKLFDDYSRSENQMKFRMVSDYPIHKHFPTI